MPRADAGRSDFPRDARGSFAISPDTAERDAEALNLSIRGRTLQAIGDQLGMTKQSAALAVKRGRSAVSTLLADEQVKEAVAELDYLRAVAHRVLETDHYVVSAKGAIVYRNRKPLIDDAPTLAALDRLLKINEQRRKIFGTDAPTKARVEVHTTNGLDRSIASLIEEMDARDQGAGARNDSDHVDAR